MGDNNSQGGSWVVREYNRYDNQWTDVTQPASHEEALRVWNQKTANGTRMTKYEDGRYYAVFPAGFQMLFSNGFGEV